MQTFISVHVSLESTEGRCAQVVSVNTYTSCPSRIEDSTIDSGIE